MVETYKKGLSFVTRVETNWALRRQAEIFVEDVGEGRDSLLSGAVSKEDIRFVETILKMQHRQFFAQHKIEQHENFYLS